MKPSEIEKLHRLAHWALCHIEDWQLICGADKWPLSQEEFDRLAELLLDEGFFELYYALFYRFAEESNFRRFPPTLVT